MSTGTVSRTLFFTIGKDNPVPVHDMILESVSAISGVSRATSLRPTATDANVRRFCMAQLSDDADLDRVRDEIAAVAGVDSVGAPSQRRLF